jgi:copper transport protein
VLRRGIVPVVLTLFMCGVGVREASAHAGLQRSDPAAGAMLGATPTAVRLSFSEEPEAALSVIRVLGTSGAAYQLGTPERVPGDPLGLLVHTSPLEQGVYTVEWRVVSAVDGHATAGSYAFGVRASPIGVAAVSRSTSPVSSPLEVVARWTLLAGLISVLGAAAASIGRFGSPSGEDQLGGMGWGLSVAGLGLLAVAQRGNAASSFAALFHTSVGRALIWRAVAVGAAGVAVLVARRGSSRIRRGAMLAAGLAAVAAVGVHAAAGHAAAGGSRSVQVAVQSAHLAAVGVWIGGLIALLLGVRGAPSSLKASAVRRFSTVAAVALLVVAATGAVRAVRQVSSWGDLVSTGYGRGVLAKGALILGIAAFGAMNRWRSVPAAATDLGRLRRTSRGELALAAAAVAVAALLGTLAPPAAGESAVPLGLSISGSDFGTTLRVRLTTASDQPGPNRFVVRAVDYDTNAPIEARNVSLRFIPLDDPGVGATSLVLSRRPDGSYAGSGANIAFDGRWEVNVLVERANNSVEVPLELETNSPPQFVSIERRPGMAPNYTVQVGDVGYVRVSPHPERAGRSELYVTCYDAFEDYARIGQFVLATAAGDGPVLQRPVRRLGTGRFVSDVDLQEGRNAIAVVAWTRDGTRLRAEVELQVPGA